MTPANETLQTPDLTGLDFTPTCHTRSGCNQPVFAHVRILTPCGCPTVWSVCRHHLVLTLTDSATRHWYCRSCGQTWASSVADLPKEIV